MEGPEGPVEGLGWLELGPPLWTCEVFAATLGVAPATAHGHFLHGQARPVKDRQASLVRAPLAPTELDPLFARPRLHDRVQLLFAQVEATEVVGELAQLDVEHSYRLPLGA